MRRSRRDDEGLVGPDRSGVLTTGCETVHTHDQSGGIDQPAFEKLWDLYERCRTGSDLESVFVSAARLSRALPPRPHRPSGVPSPFARFVARQPLRLAADPSAMAADCTLRAARAAQSAGLTPLAQEAFEPSSNASTTQTMPIIARKPVVGSPRSVAWRKGSLWRSL